MKTLLEKLWNGELSPCCECRKSSKEMKGLTSELSNLYDALFKSLNSEQKAILTEYDECQLKITEINEQQIFEYAFSLGAKFALEML